jgi:hypothetical protein
MTRGRSLGPESRLGQCGVRWGRKVVWERIVVSENGQIKCATNVSRKVSPTPHWRCCACKGRDRCMETWALCWDRKVVLGGLGIRWDRKVVFGDLDMSLKYVGFKHGTLLM